ncbi:DUF3575 domain-containing protein [Hymenobacter gummosus]|uniref:DUF3575 domain-containing protein n=1 Tax=Hymenobacter gummosus TaxID=1776032 RepID=A0A3S0HJM9_9BACT|nr:DUF3575 domain-containing protein [Hymenobacter gummosus]RTQ45693.1 DUF3575 domain-containing protein [Hymenobacter gummosus]
MFLSYATLPGALLLTTRLLTPCSAAPKPAPHAHSFPADTIRHTASRATGTHLLKLGSRLSLLTGLATVPQLQYEARISPDWSLQAGAGYRLRERNLGVSRRITSSFFTLDAGARRYNNAATRAPLSGSYFGFGLGAVYIDSRTRTVDQPEIEHNKGALVQAQGQWGTQAALSRRLTLDLSLGASLACRLTTADTQRIWFSPEIGLALGYRH